MWWRRNKVCLGVFGLALGDLDVGQGVHPFGIVLVELEGFLEGFFGRGVVFPQLVHVADHDVGAGRSAT